MTRGVHSPDIEVESTNEARTGHSLLTGGACQIKVSFQNPANVSHIDLQEPLLPCQLIDVIGLALSI